MKRHLKTDFRQFILERIKNDAQQEDEIEEVEPDDDIDGSEDEPIEDEDEFEFDDLDDEEESQADDDLIEELHKKYKTLKRIYEHRLHQRKTR